MNVSSYNIGNDYKAVPESVVFKWWGQCMQTTLPFLPEGLSLKTK